MQAWWRFARGVAYARTGAGRRGDGRTDGARPGHRARAGDGAVRRHRPRERVQHPVDWRRLVLDARLAWAREARAESLGLWMKAVAAADRVAYDEPPVWFYPIRESLGAVLLETGRPADAERVFREDLVRHPRNPRSLFGLHESLLKQGRTTDAAWIKATFDEVWRHADQKLNIADF